MAALECKSSRIIAADFIDSPLKFAQIAGAETIVPGVVFGGDTTQRRTQGLFLAWSEFAASLARTDFGLKTEG